MAADTTKEQKVATEAPPAQPVAAPAPVATAIKEQKVATTPAGRGCEQWRSVVQRYDWNVDVALAVMRAESGCNHMADNTGLNRDGTNDKGLMQINSIHVTSGLISDQARFDPAANIDTAYKLYRGAGNSFTPWAAYNSGKHLQYL